MRVTEKDLDRVVEQINTLYSKLKGTMFVEIVTLKYAFEGVKATYMNGVNIACTGYTTKKECYYVLVAFKQGLLTGMGE
jgi:hypothetical protein